MVGPTADEIHLARLALAALDPALARAHAVAPLFEWRDRVCGFAGLAKLIIEQQVSIPSAAAISRRFEEGLGTVTPATALAQGFDGLKALGLSGQKASYVIGLAEAAATGNFDFSNFAALNDAAAVAELMRLRGIGRWTAEAYLMGCEGRTDIFPAGDLALQEGLRFADGSETRLSEKLLYKRAEQWRPYRSVAALLLWSYYAAVKRSARQQPLGASVETRPTGPATKTPSRRKR